MNNFWKNDRGYIKKFDGSREDRFFDPLIDRVYQHGILGVFCLKEGCAECEKLMVLIENMNQMLVKRPNNMIIAWGVSSIEDQGNRSNSSSIKLKGETTHMINNDFTWDKIQTHGFALSCTTSEYLIFEDDHSSRILGRYLKKIYRRMSMDLITTKILNIGDDFEKKSKSGIIVEHPANLSEQDEIKLEKYFSFFRRKFNVLTYFLENPSSTGNISYYSEGKKKVSYDGLDEQKFFKNFLKHKKR